MPKSATATREQKWNTVKTYAALSSNSNIKNIEKELRICIPVSQTNAAKTYYLSHTSFVQSTPSSILVIASYIACPLKLESYPKWNFIVKQI